MSKFLLTYFRCYTHAWQMLRAASGAVGREHLDIPFLIVIAPFIPVSPFAWFAVVAWRDMCGKL